MRHWFSECENMLHKPMYMRIMIGSYAFCVLIMYIIYIDKVRYSIYNIH